MPVLIGTMNDPSLQQYSPSVMYSIWEHRNRHLMITHDQLSEDYKKTYPDDAAAIENAEKAIRTETNKAEEAETNKAEEAETNKTVDQDQVNRVKNWIWEHRRWALKLFEKDRAPFLEAFQRHRPSPLKPTESTTGLDSPPSAASNVGKGNNQGEAAKKPEFKHAIENNEAAMGPQNVIVVPQGSYTGCF